METTEIDDLGLKDAALDRPWQLYQDLEDDVDLAGAGSASESFSSLEEDSIEVLSGIFSFSFASDPPPPPVSFLAAAIES